MTDDEALRYIAGELGDYFKDEPEKIVYWLMTENHMLGGSKPAQLMLSHPRGHEKLASFVRDFVEGNLP